jgi:hypothetical protein
MVLTYLVPAAIGEDSVASQIAGMPAGAKIELGLKDKQTLRGAEGPVSNTGLCLSTQVPADTTGGRTRVLNSPHLSAPS